MQMVPAGDSFPCRGHVIRTFGSGQKANGWFAGVFLAAEGYSFKVTGVYSHTLDLSLTYDIKVNKSVHPVYGIQYQIESMSPYVKQDEESIIRYLSSGSFKGIGLRIAEKIVDEFGTDSLDMICTDPGEVQARCGLTNRQIHILVKGEASVSFENKMRKLCPFVSDSLIEKMSQVYEDEDGNISWETVSDILKNDPYRILDDMEDVPFEEADRIALHLRYEMYDRERMNQCYLHALKKFIRETHGLFVNTAKPDEYNRFYAMVLHHAGYMHETTGPYGVSYPQTCYDAVNPLFLNPGSVPHVLTDVGNSGETIIYSGDTYLQETDVGSSIGSLIKNQSVFMAVSGCSVSAINNDIAIYEKKKRIKLDDSQKIAVLSSLLSPVSVIDGGPGHGKTSCVDCILFIWSRHVPDEMPVLAAPTGRAVTVLRNATENSYEVATAARIIATAERNKALGSKDAAHFSKFTEMVKSHTGNLVVLDECSMVGMGTASEFLRLFTDCQFIFVGDDGQLPSIEHGQFFHDLCTCGAIRRTTLDVNHRAEGKIVVENAERIRVGDYAGIDTSCLYEFLFVPSYGDYSDAIMDAYCSYVLDSSGNVDESKLKSVGVLSPVGKGPTGFLELNRRIQDLVNPKDANAEPCEKGYVIDDTHMYVSQEHKDVKLRVGDIVMQTVNHTDMVCTISAGKKKMSSTGFFNGDTGTIISFNPASGKEDEDSITVLLHDGRNVTVPEFMFKELKLAYAMSIHKSQGSEFDRVILSWPGFLGSMNNDFASRNLLYTGVTRARKGIAIFGDRGSLDACILKEIPDRNSMLGTRILDAARKHGKGD